MRSFVVLMVFLATVATAGGQSVGPGVIIPGGAGPAFVPNGYDTGTFWPAWRGTDQVSISNAVPSIVTMPADPRYRFYHGLWWYWMTDSRWVYWNGTTWIDLATGATVPTTAQARTETRPASAGSQILMKAR